MALEITIEERTISGTGVLRIPTENLNERIYTLYAQVIRKPKSPYLNFKSNPPEGFFGRITCVKNDTVYQHFDHVFPMQAWNFTPDITSQVLVAVQCQYAGILQTFVNLGAALGLNPYVVGNTIEDFKALGIGFNEIRVVCYANTAIKLTLKAKAFDICNSNQLEPEEPPAPPPPPNEVPSDTAIEIDEPYENDSISKKADIDENFTPPPIGNTCIAYNIQYSYTQQNGVIGTEGNRVFGEIGRIRRFSNPGENGVELECRGIAGGSRTCSVYQFYRLTGGPPPNDYINPTLDNMSPA